MVQVQLQNLYLPTDSVGISGASLYLNPTGTVYPAPATPPAASATSGKWGSAQLDVSSLAAGNHTLWVVPIAATDIAVGPDLAAQAGAPNRIYRGMSILLTVAGEKGKAKVTAATVNAATVNNGSITLDAGKQELLVKLRPVFIQAKAAPTAAAMTPDMIIVHRTAGFGSAINEFLNTGKIAHYLINREGYVLKMALDNRRGGHAGEMGTTFWGTHKDLNFRSIGIENIANDAETLTKEQYTSLIDLIHTLMTKYSIVGHRVIGHSDVRAKAGGILSTDRVACPGRKFDWTQLENANPKIGLQRSGGAGGGTDPVAEFFTAMQADGVNNLRIRLNDHDPSGTGKQAVAGVFGGKAYPKVTATPIKQLQTWLADIGYSVGPADGIFNQRTMRAVVHFETHFAAAVDERLDQTTAALIRAVWLANPKAA